MKKYYLFDFDGTLVDSMPYWAKKMLNILNKAGVAYPDDIITTIATLGDAGSVEYFKTQLNVPFSKEQMFEMMDEYALPKYRDVILLKEGVKNALIKLKEQGNSLNVLTASPHKMLDPCLIRNDVYQLFDNIWSTDDLGLPKTNPEIYLTVANKLNACVSDVMFFDDNINAICTANKAGVYTVGVFDRSGKQFEEQIKSNANKFVYSFKEL